MKCPKCNKEGCFQFVEKKRRGSGRDRKTIPRSSNKKICKKCGYTEE